MDDINIDLNIVKQEPFDEFDNTKPIDTFVSSQNCTYSDNAMPIDTVVSSNEIINEVLSKLAIKQEPTDKDFQNYTSSDDAMPIDTYDSLNEPDIKQEPFNEDSQNCASSDDAKPIDTFVPSKEIEDAEREIKKESEDSENSEDFELKEIQREKNKQKKIKNNLISESSNIFLYAKSCPNCKKSFNSPLIKKKIMHFNNEKHNHNNFDYDSSEEVAKDLETKKIYEYFSIEKLNVDNKKNMKEKKVKNKEDFRDDDHKKKLGTKIETDDIV
ncbi:unnamed protein product [Rhizophagus irregularis]|nr:unnamed protein product [Rhizophagus irregularis]